jgi:hypothetical protein
MNVLSQSLVAEERLIAGIASDWLGSNEKKNWILAMLLAVVEPQSLGNGMEGIPRCIVCTSYPYLLMNHNRGFL